MERRVSKEQQELEEHGNDRHDDEGEAKAQVNVRGPALAAGFCTVYKNIFILG